MFPKRTLIIGLVLAVALVGCGRKPPLRREPPRPPSPGVDYAASPEVIAARGGAGGTALEGAAAPGSLVRLATPAGAALETRADAAGRWRLSLPPAAEPQVFGLSERIGGRPVQAQGYVLVGPGGKAALLRAGAGALRLDRAAGPRIGAFDFDHEGAAIVSGEAPGMAWLSLRLDGRQAAEARADTAGRYSIAIDRLTSGPHTLEVVGDGFTSAGRVEVAPAAPLVAGPLRSQFTQGGLRADWLTPGGGVQSTILLD